MAPPAREADLTDEQKAILNLVRSRKERAERLHRSLADQWNEEYGLYRNYRKLKATAQQAGQRDRGGVLLDAKRAWGADLHIPTAYATIETIVPRAISNPPRMTARPNTEDAVDASEPVAKLLNRQQEEINYEMTLQATARRGFIFGLGVQKTYWEKKTRSVKYNTPASGVADRVRFRSGLQTKDKTIIVHEGPQAEDVDIFDFFWDPAAKNIATCEWVIHRTWRSMDYIARMVKLGEKTEGKDGWRPVDLEKVAGLADDSARGAVWADRMAAAGLSNFDTQQGALHEVWEYHDREKVCTILDKQLVVQEKPNPNFHGDLPFQIFRPTIVPGEFCGYAEVEAIKHLIYELDTLRGQRRDAATLALFPPIFYSQGALDEKDVVYGPGVWVPTLMEPRDAIFPLKVGDVPGSAYQESDEIKADMKEASGVSDAVAGADPTSSGDQTATGIQLIQAAANVRIKLKTRNLIRELVKPAAEQFFLMNRQHQLKDKSVRVEDANSEQGYGFVTVTPRHLAADLEIIPDADSTEPDNVPAQRQDALSLYNATSQDPAIDPRKRLEHFLREYGVANAESWLIPEPPATPQVDPEAIGQALKDEGLPEDLVLQAMQAALQATQGQNGAAPEPATQGVS